MKYEFHYRLEKELKAGIDEQGNPAEAYAQFSFESPLDLSEEKIKKIHEGPGRRQIAMGDAEYMKYVTPITKEEYDREAAVEEETD